MVDGSLKVHGIEYLSIAEVSIMTRVATGDTMVTYIIIGERSAEIMPTANRVETSPGTGDL